MDGKPVLRLSSRTHVTARLSRASGALDRGNPQVSGHTVRRAELRLRAVRAACGDRSDRRSRSLELAYRVQRGRAGQSGHNGPVHGEVRPVRVRRQRNDPRLRTCGGDTRSRIHAGRARSPGRDGRRRCHRAPCPGDAGVRRGARRCPPLRLVRAADSGLRSPDCRRARDRAARACGRRNRVPRSVDDRRLLSQSGGQPRAVRRRLAAVGGPRVHRRRRALRHRTGQGPHRSGRAQSLPLRSRGCGG